MRADFDTAALVERAQRGQRDALATLVAAFLRPAYVVALGIVRRPADAEDVAQESLVAAIEKLSTCRQPARFAGWLLQIVRHRALNFVERRRLRDTPAEEPAERGATDEVPMTDAALQARLVAALDGVTSVQREVVLLHDLEEWTHAEIAAALGVSELMSRQHLFNARRTLRAALAADAPAVEPFLPVAVEVKSGRGG